MHDVIAFTAANGTVVIHRVMGIQDGGFITRGDANNADDPAVVKASQVIGTCAFNIPIIGYLFLLPAIRYIWIALALCAVLCLILIK